MVRQTVHVLVCVPCDLIPDHDALHQPLGVEPRVVVTHLHGGQFAQVLALKEKRRKKTQNGSIIAYWEVKSEGTFDGRFNKGLKCAKHLSLTSHRS